MNHARPLPPLKVIAAALRVTTERLIGEFAAPTPEAPDWSEFEWRVARAVCVMQGIGGLLATRLCWRGPAQWHEFLEGQREHVAARDVRIVELLAALDERLRHRGIGGVPLKGSALRALDIYGAGERPQSDIDLLIRPADFAACAELLGSLGYTRMFSTRRHDAFQPDARAPVQAFGEHRDLPIKIELHDKVSEELPIDVVDITASLTPATLRPGNNDYVNRAALMRHLCLHTAGGMRANAGRFIQIFDIAAVARLLQASDWRDLVEVDEPRRNCWWLYAPLLMAERHLPGSVPAPVLAGLRGLAPRWLRRRYESIPFHVVSWSNLRIAALPGCEWSRSPGEALRYLCSRLVPSKVALDDLAAVKIGQPQMLRQRWYGASHPERIARWLFTQPPRVQTLSAVTASLEH
jgi:hypothetical protein